FRSPDPWYALEGKIVVRRLSPNNRKLDANELDDKTSLLVDADMLHAMGRDLAAVHLGAKQPREAIRSDLAGRDAGWLRKATDDAVTFVCVEQKKWKSRKA